MADLICVGDFQQAAAKKLQPSILGYYNGGSGNEVTLAENVSAFDK